MQPTTTNSSSPSSKTRHNEIGLYDLSRVELGDLLSDQPRYRIDQLWEGLYRQRKPLADLTNLPKQLRADLGDIAGASLRPANSVSTDRGRTTKQLWSLTDGQLVESVVMHYYNRTTVCISSQAGCAMGCTFCATGQMGFRRHLSVGEIVEQVLRAYDPSSSDSTSTNVVFMGMGEPLANFDAVWKAVERLHDDVGIGARRITISTVGIIPGIKRLAEAPLPVNLAVSLHAANDKLRNQLAPINRQYPLADLARTLQEYRKAKNRRISIEWAMIDGVNDTADDAYELAEYARPLGAHVNLIPLNATPGYIMTPSTRGQIEWFANELLATGVNATIRANRGTDIDAACGQLSAGFASKAVNDPKRRPQRNQSRSRG